MIRYFRINDPYRLLGLLALMVLLYTPQLIDLPPITLVELKGMVIGEKVAEGFMPYSEIIDHTAPLASWFYGFCDWLLGRSLLARHIFACIILFLQSAFISMVFIEKKAFTENTYVPSFLFSVLTLIAFDVITLTADLAAFGFLLLALNNLFKQIEFRVQRDETLVNMGLYLSLSSLFLFSYSFFLAAFFLLMILFTRSTLRQYLLLLFGFSLPHALFFAFYFMSDAHTGLIQQFYQTNFFIGRSSLISLTTLLIVCSVPLIYLLLALIVLNRNARLTKYQSQLLQAMFLWFVFALLHAWLSPDLRPQTLLPVAPAVAFLLTHFFLLIRRRRFVEFYAWVFVVGVTTTGYLSRYELLPVNWSGLFVPASTHLVTGKKILVLGDHPELWVQNRLSPPFVNWELSRAVFDNANEYRSVLLVNKLFKADPPEIIIDPENRMQAFYNRLPALAARYKKSAGGWEVVSN
ncbi:MAG: hypothetical protein L6Q51_04295 [Cyclobacteriaceae bacterium]|nr:hypothetical protein [Cyclobacteriaceae bacterium]